jgi:hypothetical protein
MAAALSGFVGGHKEGGLGLVQFECPLLTDFVAEVGFTLSEDGVSVFTDEVSRRF